MTLKWPRNDLEMTLKVICDICKLTMTHWYIWLCSMTTQQLTTNNQQYFSFCWENSQKWDKWAFVRVAHSNQCLSCHGNHYKHTRQAETVILNTDAQRDRYCCWRDGYFDLFWCMVFIPGSIKRWLSWYD